MRKSATIFFFTLLILLLQGEITKSQSMGFSFPEGKTKQVIPFNNYNNLIVIPININDAITVDFILDTSIEHTIITEKAVGDQANIKYLKKINMGGTSQNPVDAYIASNVKLKLRGDVVSKFGQQVLIMEHDYFNLRSATGADIYGIIGYDIFKRFIVEVNNTNGVIILYEPKEFKVPKGYSALPINIIGTKPFVNTKVTFENWDVLNLELMVDIGANHAILFSGDSSSFLVPTRNLNVTIAKTFEGEIKGFVGRVRSLKIDEFDFENPIASFSGSEDMYLVKEEYNNKKGAIGQGILTRFDMILDFHHKILYLKKNAKFKDKFEYDMSGLSISKNEFTKDSYIVSNIIIDSPAQNAGLEMGDIIKKINGTLINEKNYYKLISLFRSKSGKTITIDYLRNQKAAKVSFILYKMI